MHSGGVKEWMKKISRCLSPVSMFPAAAGATLLLAALWLVPATAAAGPAKRLENTLGPTDSVLLLNPAGKVLFSHHSDEKRVPASTLKVLTALAAIDYLGLDYRFPTRFYLNSYRDLIIKGFGDPLLVSESVAGIASRLKAALEKKGVKRLRHIILDDSYFETSRQVPGTAAATIQPYNAPNGALCVNFNTVHFKTENGRIVSAEPQTPMLPLAISRIREKNQPSGRILLSDHRGDTLLYAGQLFAYFFNQAGLETTGAIRAGRLKAEANPRLLYEHVSEWELAVIIERLLEYSNNFMANQLLLAVGASVHGPPATIEKGVRALRAYAQKQLGLEDLQVVEGSGISRQNRLSAQTFARVLEDFAPYHDLLPRNGRVYAKTGTLHGIRTLAGYINSQEKELYRFVIFLNTAGRKTEPVLSEINAMVP